MYMHVLVSKSESDDVILFIFVKARGRCRDASVWPWFNSQGYQPHKTLYEGFVPGQYS